MDAKVSCGIELYRKGYGKITVKNSNGEVVPGAKISLTQKDHEFKFGANIFMLDEFETEEKNKAYRELFRSTFNMATLPFYWNATEPEKGKTRYAKDSEKMYRRPPIDLCMEYCEENGIEPREHGLAYMGFFPKWLKYANEFEAKCALENRYKEISERYGHRIPTIEVTNEMEWPWASAKASFYNSPDFIEWCFKTAEKYFPCNTLCINERGILAWEEKARVTDKYFAYIEAAMSKGARIDAIGAQFHSYFKPEEEVAKSRVRYDVAAMYRHLDMYGSLGKPIHLTEVSLPSYTYDEEDEAIQAELLEKLYSIWFSHPAVEQIVYWNLVDGYAHKAQIGDMSAGENIYKAGLVRFDMTPKPAFHKLNELIRKKWHTETETETAEDGIARFRGFYGNYKAVVTLNGETKEADLRLMKNGVNEYVIII